VTIQSLIERLPAYEDNVPKCFHLSVLVPVYNERHVVEASLRRVLALEHPLISELQVVVVDDASSDGSRSVLERLAEQDARIVLLYHDRNQGKGAAIRTALGRATGDIVIVHGADLEYNPADIPALLVPFAREGADAVFGSRYLAAPYRRALTYRHTAIDKCLTTLSNWFSGLALTDVTTGYKAVHATLLKSIPVRSHDFRFDTELVVKLAKRRARIFEAPIRYLPRTAAEGKKMRPRDGLLAALAMIRFSISDDLYQSDQAGSRMLVEIERARRFNAWLAETVRPYLGDRILEIGAGIGNFTNHFIPRSLYLASDIDPNHLHSLRSYSIGKPYMRVMHIDATNPEHFRDLEHQFDTVLMLNVLEHVPDEQQALRNAWRALQPGGRAIILVPQYPGLYGTLDEALGHRERYTPATLEAAMRRAGFRLQETFDFNRYSVPAWWFHGKVLRRRRLSRLQVQGMEVLMPLLKRIDRLLPWSGISIIALGVKHEDP
jgi:glycosyltransferase involved in cell wall biosynthesis